MDRDKKAVTLKSTNKVQRTAPKPLTTASISALKPGKLLADGAIRPGAGSLKIRKRQNSSGGVVCEWIFEWSRSGKTVRQSIGRYNVNESSDGLTLTQARTEAGRLQAIIKSGNDPIAQRDAERHAARARVEVEKSQRLRADEKNLTALLAAYIADLRRRGKTDSAYDAENIFANHIQKPFSEIASLPAAQVRPEHFSKILSRLVGPEIERKKGRTALKLRSYASAAFNMALGASLDPMALAAAQEFGLTINPAATVPPKAMAAKFNRVGERVLSDTELWHYLIYVAALDADLPRLILQLQIATCGQRIQQLLRISHADVNGKTMNIYDPKGKRTEPRKHTLPLLPEVVEILDELRRLNPQSEEQGQDTPLFSSRESVMSPETISDTVHQISDAMQDQKLTDKPFRAGDIRRTIETMLAETLRISKDDRAQLLSHGLSGVQDRVYDKGEHLPAKTEAMRLWNDHIADLCIGAHITTAQHPARDSSVDTEKL